MLARFNLNLAILLACAVVAGCATSRSEIALKSPGAAAAPASASARTAVIRSVKDERIFEQAPSEPSIPSLGFEGAAQASAEIKARAVGRKRNTYGKALGDVLLGKGQTVEGVVRDNLAAALTEAGYQVATEESTAQALLVIDVHIRQFWAWVQPGFWAIKLKTNISTDLDLSGGAEPASITVHVEDSRQAATEGAWMQVVEKALAAFRAEVVTEAKNFP